MTPTYRSPMLPKGVLITSVHCAICRRFASTGHYTIAPASSIYAGKPICGACIDLAPSPPAKRVGPSERKDVQLQRVDSTDGKSHAIERGLRHWMDHL